MVVSGSGSSKGIERMMRFQAGCLALRLSPMLLVAACSSAPCVGSSTDDLSQRLQMELAPDISTNRVTLEQLPEGARVTLVDRSLLAGDGAQLTQAGYDVVTRVSRACWLRASCRSRWRNRPRPGCTARGANRIDHAVFPGLRAWIGDAARVSRRRASEADHNRQHKCEFMTESQPAQALSAKAAPHTTHPPP